MAKGADCKSVWLTPTLVRIQPPPPKRNVQRLLLSEADLRGKAGRSSMVEPQPSKLMTRVRFPFPRSKWFEISRGCAATTSARSLPCVGLPMWLSGRALLGREEVARSIRAMGTT